MTVTHQCVRSGAGGHSVYTPVHCMGTTGWGGHASVCGVYHNCGLCVVLYKSVHVRYTCYAMLTFYGHCTGAGMGATA